MSTTTESSATPPIACVPGAISDDERPSHFALIARLFGGMQKEDVPSGYAFRFEADQFGDVCRFVSNERKCCPFLSFVVELTPGGGPLLLRLTGPEGTREFLAAEFSTQG